MNNQVEFVALDKCRINRYQIDNIRDQAVIDEIKQSVLMFQDNGSLGLIEFPVARKLPDGSYELAFGRHRFYAFEELVNEGHTQFNVIPVTVRELTDIEMHELMGIEMLQHRVVNDIEEAKMFDSYMTHFKKTSVECALKFGKTNEYVRQQVRLLDLPTAAQELIQEGTLNKTNGRELLTLGRIGGEALIEKTINVFLHNKDTKSFSEVAKQELVMSDDSVWLDGGAKWFGASTMLQKHLKPLTREQVELLCNFLPDVKKKEQERIIGEIVTLLASGMEVTHDAFGAWLEERAIDAIRIAANPTACNLCPFHVTLNSDHYCGIELCRDRKTQAFEQHDIEQAAKKTGVPIYQKSDGKYYALNSFDTAHKKIWKEGSADLRLLVSKHEYNNFDGVTHNFKVVLVGETAEKQLQKDEKKKEKNQAEGKQEAKADNDHALDRKRRSMREYYCLRFGWEIASYALSSAFDGINSLGLLEFMESEINGMPDFPHDFEYTDWLTDLEKMKKAEQLKQRRRMFTYLLFDLSVNVGRFSDDKKCVLKYQEALEKMAVEKWEVKLPKDFRKQAEKYQVECEAALKEVK